MVDSSKSTKGNKNKYGFLDERSNKEYIVTTNLTPIQRGIQEGFGIYITYVPEMMFLSILLNMSILLACEIEKLLQGITIGQQYQYYAKLEIMKFV